MLFWRLPLIYTIDSVVYPFSGLARYPTFVMLKIN